MKLNPSAFLFAGLTALAGTGMGFYCQTDIDEEALPFDQHMLLALVAPRHLCVGSCKEDSWAGPTGQRWACQLASPAWERLGVGGYGDRVRWHIVPGAHDLSIANWRHHLDAMDAVEAD